MHELFPLVAGAGAGWALVVPLARRWSLRTLALSAVVIGVLASGSSGELADSAAFVIWDTAQALAASVAAAVLAGSVQRRCRRRCAVVAERGRREQE